MYPKDIPVPFPIEFITIPSSNYREREKGVMPDAIAIHIGEGPKRAIVGEFQRLGSQKSSHFLVNRDGSITQFVNTSKVAFCTGNIDNPINQLVLERKVNPNSWSFAIEHEGYGNANLTIAQYESTAQLCKFLHDKWGVPLNRTHIFGHREVYSKKSCPGIASVDKIVQMARKLM